MPMDEIMRLPVSDRKFYIQKHNREQDELKAELEGGNGDGYSVSGEALNTYAEISQNDPLR